MKHQWFLRPLEIDSLLLDSFPFESPSIANAYALTANSAVTTQVD
jgi:hypothetical protein